MRPWEFWLGVLMLVLSAALILVAIVLALRARRSPAAPYSAPIHDPRD